MPISVRMPLCEWKEEWIWLWAHQAVGSSPRIWLDLRHRLWNSCWPLPWRDISGEMFEKLEEELLAYHMPVSRVIQDDSIKDIQEIEDREFMAHIERAVEELADDDT